MLVCVQMETLKIIFHFTKHLIFKKQDTKHNTIYRTKLEFRELLPSIASQFDTRLQKKANFKNSCIKFHTLVKRIQEDYVAPFFKVQTAFRVLK